MELELLGTQAKTVDLEKWAAITIEKFEYAVAKYNLIYSGDLLRSFEATVQIESGGDKALISFAFQYYLRMLDMGVGKGVKYEDAGRGSKRRKYPVFNKIYFSEVMRLNELLIKMYADRGGKVIAYGVNGQIS